MLPILVAKDWCGKCPVRPTLALGLNPATQTLAGPNSAQADAPVGVTLWSMPENIRHNEHGIGVAKRGSDAGGGRIVRADFGSCAVQSSVDRWPRNRECAGDPHLLRMVIIFIYSCELFA